MYNDDFLYNNFSDDENEFVNDNNIIYNEDIYQIKIRQIENFKNLIYYEPEFTAIHNISSQEILTLIENSLNNKHIVKQNKFFYNPPQNQINYFYNIYNTILDTNGIKNFNINNTDILSIMNIIYFKLYV